jgi:hypothetical protein
LKLRLLINIDYIAFCKEKEVLNLQMQTISDQLSLAATGITENSKINIKKATHYFEQAYIQGNYLLEE